MALFLMGSALANGQTITTVAQIKADQETYLNKEVTLVGALIYIIDDDDKKSVNADPTTFDDDNDEGMFKDATGEIRMDFQEGNVAKLGQQITVTGYVQLDDGNLEVNVSNWVPGSGGGVPPPVEPTLTTVQAIRADGTSFYGNLVGLIGKITSKVDDDEFVLDDGTGTIKVDFEGNQIPTVGDSVILTGRVGWDDSDYEVDVKSWQPTGGSPVEPPTALTPTVAEIKADPTTYNNAFVKINGKLTRRWGNDDDEFEFDDGTATIKVEFKTGDYAPIGYDIEIQGFVETDDSELEIDIHAWTFTGEGGGEIPAPEEPSVAEINADPASYRGRYVLLEGATTEAVSNETDEYLFNDGTDVIRVDFPSNDVPEIAEQVLVYGRVEKENGGTYEVDVTLWTQATAIRDVTGGGDLLQLNNYPNPFGDQTTLSFYLQKESSIDIAIYSVSGKLAKEIRHALLTAGKHEVRLDAGDLSDGIYYLMFSTDTQQSTLKLSVQK